MNTTHRAKKFLITLAASAAALTGTSLFGADAPTFKKIQLSDKFYSEGATVGDFNKDGKMDYAAGGVWYEGPDFKTKHEFAKYPETDPHGYSQDFLTYTGDFNKDGWDDVLVIGFPGAETVWYENPQGKEGEWKKHFALRVTDNESPRFGDLTGDGKPELICHTAGRLGWAEPNLDKPDAEWTFHPITSKPDGRFQRFTHGIGFGDVNGDKKNDILEARGWWEQPASLSGDAEWKFHPADFGGGGAQMYAYDINGDGKNDVLTSLQAHGYGLAWYENKGADDKGEIKFEQHLILSPDAGKKTNDVQFSQLHAIDLADFNSDGLMDFVTGKRYWAHAPNAQGQGGDPGVNDPAVLYWFELTRKDGKAEFVAHLIDDNSGVGTEVMAADVNGDKKPDVVVGNKKGQFIFIQESK